MYCPACQHRASDHSASAGCLLDCPCRVPAADCVADLSYRYSQTGDHAPADCAAARAGGNDAGWHAGWGACRDAADPYPELVACEWSDAGECAFARERAVAGLSNDIPSCPVHGAYPA